MRPVTLAVSMVALGLVAWGSHRTYRVSELLQTPGVPSRFAAAQKVRALLTDQEIGLRPHAQPPWALR
jgi:hypothetical protein